MSKQHHVRQPEFFQQFRTVAQESRKINHFAKAQPRNFTLRLFSPRPFALPDCPNRSVQVSRNRNGLQPVKRSFHRIQTPGINQIQRGGLIDLFDGPPALPRRPNRRTTHL